MIPNVMKTRNWDSYAAKLTFAGLLLLGGLLVQGCKTSGITSDIKPQIERQLREGRIALELASACSAYYSGLGRWPQTLDTLRTTDMEQIRDDARESFAKQISQIPWEELKGKVAFKVTSDGALTFSVPPLGQAPTTGGCTTIIQIPVTYDRASDKQ